MRKAAAIFVIALVLVAAVLLHPDRTNRALAARPLAVHTVALPGITLPAPSTADPARDRNRVQRAASYAPASSRVAAAPVFTKMHGRLDMVPPLDARPLFTAADPAPAVVDPGEVERPGHLPRALATAANQTRGALRTASRAIRSVF